MKTAFKLFVSVFILLVAAIVMSIFLCEKQSSVQNHTVKTTSQTKAGQENPKTYLPNSKFTQEGQSEGNSATSASPPYADNEHTKNKEREHGEIILWGIKLGDIVAILALSISAILGTAALVFTAWGIKQNRISNEKQNRAYVTVDSCRVRMTQSGMEAIVILKNVGATPAKEISLTHWFGTARDYNARLPRSGNIPMVAVEGNFFLGPSDKKTITVKMEGANMPPEILGGLLNGSWNLLLDGDMTYEDEFGQKFRLLYHFKKRTEQGEFFGQMVFAKDGLQITLV